MPSKSRLSMLKFLLAQMLIIGFSAACQSSNSQSPGALTPTLIPTSELHDLNVEKDLDPFEGVDLAITGVDGNILLADVDSKQVVNLTNDAMLDPLEGERFISYAEPTWSPVDGKLGFIRTIREQGNTTAADIIVRWPGQDEIKIGADSETPFYLYWSPKGDQLSFLASSPGEPISLWVKDLSDQGGRVDRGQPYYWAWAPNGSQLLAHVGGSIDMNPQGAYLSFIKPERVELELAPLYFQAPAFSPDGDLILVSARALIGSDALLLLGADGQILQEIVPVEGRASFSWAADDSQFAVSVGPDIGGSHIGVLSLFSMNEDRQAELESKIAEDVIAFWWSPDGEKIVYFVPVLSPSDLTQPISYQRQEENELFLQLFVYDLTTDTSERLTSFRPTSEFLRILPYYDQYQRSATIWSANSEYIVYATNGESGVSQIFIVRADGSSAPARITEGEIAYWSRKSP